MVCPFLKKKTKCNPYPKILDFSKLFCCECPYAVKNKNLGSLSLLCGLLFYLHITRFIILTSTDPARKKPQLAKTLRIHPGLLLGHWSGQKFASRPLVTAASRDQPVSLPLVRCGSREQAVRSWFFCRQGPQTFSCNYSLMVDS